MKLRVKGNSIRLRLLKSEVERLAVDGRVAEETSFGSNSFRYSLAVSKTAETIFAEFEDGELRVHMPESIATAWATDDQVGHEITQAGSHSDVLTILIEKDFACLDRPNDPDLEDAFPNPNVECAAS